ncbi:Gfo/Idh/MocA family protein [Thiocapsa sp.]|uniref:Gfo/Idh/MocA family protein n=1 Tax=Thiocapsa sp. TaxID=2024551 RepID=UPI002CB54C47|nr:Gfo/Idh/MocA family oxidoreductase [Thiocapsa sp.]HSO82576.1 Gfo/Idh/MocA family oxidoreductase [Thiocapsa sp.]
MVDKPFTLNIGEAEDLVERAEAAGRLLSVFHNRRWDADFLTVRRLLESGELGRLTHVESRFDRFRPEVRVRWRESGAPGRGLWYDLGARLIDQTLCLFGMPETIALDLARQRDGALADDWFHAVLRYDAMRVVLHASALAADPGPRFALHGTGGSFKTFGLDPQEAALKAGIARDGAQWGEDSSPGTLTVATPTGPDGLVRRLYASDKGD